MLEEKTPREVGEENRRRVLEYFLANPCHKNTDAAKALDLSVYAVGRHAASIRAGWRPAPEVKSNG